MNTPKPDVSIVIVGYNTRNFLVECLGSVYAQTPDLTIETIVVDNASEDGSCDMVRTSFPMVRLLANGVNLGYAAANNQAIRASSGRYILLLNPDTVVFDRAIERMVAYLKSNPNVGACGCKLLYSTMCYQRNAYPLPGPLSPLYEYSSLFQRAPFLARWIVPGWEDRPELTRPVGYCSGACFLVSRECIERVGLLDEDFFMYGEDVDWCRRMWESGRPVHYLSTATVIHHEGGSSTGGMARRRLAELRGELNYLRKWHSPASLTVYQILARGLSLIRYTSLRWRQSRAADQKSLLSDYARFYSDIIGWRVWTKRRTKPGAWRSP